MRATQAQQQGLLTILGRIYEEIRAIEEKYGLRARPDDFRPRIDYFHDAVRAFTADEGDGFERTGRLSVESLAADVTMLRQIKEKPLVRHPELAIPLSPGSQVMQVASNSLLSTAGRIDMNIANKLGDGYGHYALLFVALLSYPAERNYMNRLNEQNEQVETVLDAIADLPATDKPVDVETVLANIADPELRKKLMNALISGAKQKQVASAEARKVLLQERDATRKTIAGLETAHMRYASGQLVLYQEAPKVVKQMASQGLNIVGEFVQNAVNEAQRGGGRGF